MDQPSDDALMQAYADGDAAAFEHLYARHQAGLYRFVRRMLGPALSAQVDEVFQDTWLKVVQARGRWLPHAPTAADTADASDPAVAPVASPSRPQRQASASFRTWLFTLAHHRVIDLWRRSGRELSVDAAAERGAWSADDAQGDAWQHASASADHAGTTSLTIEEIAFWRRAGERLLHCLDQLPLPQRSAFLLHHGDGLPLDEVAQAVGVGFETAKTRLRYAMTRLRGCMGAYLATQPGSWA